MNRFLAALQFLTLIPVRLPHSVRLGEAALFFPLIGALLGILSGSLLVFARPHFGNLLASLLAITTLLLLTGGLHEDGLADVADACRAGRSPETILRILKDSRIGTYGALALIASFALRSVALSQVTLPPALALLTALTLSRTALVILAGVTPTVGGGLGTSFAAGISRRTVWLSALLGTALALLSTGGRGLLSVCAAALIILGARSYFLRRLGGINGDCLGACSQAVEVASLLILAWQPST